MGKPKPPPDAYPTCFYLPQSCPQPCAREEYVRCPVNPEARERLRVEASMVPREMDKPFDPEEYRVKADRLRLEGELRSNEHARQITETLRKLHDNRGLVCPSCGETDSHGNKMGKKPWCFKCNQPFMKVDEVKDWVKPTPPKRFNRGYNEPDGVARLRK